jgi:hypothetical protein
MKQQVFILYERFKAVEPDVKVCFLTAGEMYREEIREVEHLKSKKELVYSYITILSEPFCYFVAGPTRP